MTAKTKTDAHEWISYADIGLKLEARRSKRPLTWGVCGYLAALKRPKEN